MDKKYQIVLCAMTGFLSGVLLVPLIYSIPVSESISYALIGAFAGAIIGCS